MTQIALAALVFVLSVQPNLHISRIDGPVRVIHAVSGAVRHVEGDGAYGWLECRDGKADLLVWNGDAGVLTHEALHAADCLDDGSVNGSLLPYQPTSTDPAHEWVAYCFVDKDSCIRILGQR